MKPSLLVLFFTLLFIAPANAEFYKWIDKNGVLHVVDDLHKVPPGQRLNLGLDTEELEEAAKPKEKRKAEPAPSKKARPAQATKSTKKVAPGDELFGDKTLDWWTRTFSRLIREKSELERSIAAKEEYKRVYEIGVRLKRKEKMIPASERRYVKEFTKDTIETYKRYKKELPDDRERLAEKTEELEKLRRKAKNAAVPRKIRGE
jgi:hypothetical protein